MSPARNVRKINTKSLKRIKSTQRAGLWCPSYCSSMGKILLGLTSILIVAGFLAAILTPLLNSISKALPKEKETSTTTTIVQTITTDTTTTITSSTTSTTTSTTSTTSKTTSTTSTTRTTTSTTPRLPISLIATVTASNYDLGTGSITSQNDYLVDRSSGGGGLNTGAYPPQYVQLEFPGLYNISSIYLQVGQAPNGVTRHQLNAGSNLTSFTLVADMNNYTSSGQWINLTFSPLLTNIRYLRMNTISGPSWVAWIKFIVYDQ